MKKILGFGLIAVGVVFAVISAVLVFKVWL